MEQVGSYQLSIPSYFFLFSARTRKEIHGKLTSSTGIIRFRHHCDDIKVNRQNVNSTHSAAGIISGGCGDYIHTSTVPTWQEMSIIGSTCQNYIKSTNLDARTVSGRNAVL